MFDFSLSPLTLSFSPSLACHFALWDLAETHSLFTLPQSLSRIHLPCARATETAFKVETCLQPLSYPIYSALSSWNYFPQNNMTCLLIIQSVFIQLPVVFLKCNIFILPSRCLTFSSVLPYPLLSCLCSQIFQDRPSYQPLGTYPT